MKHNQHYPHDDVRWNTVSHQFIESGTYLQQPTEYVMLDELKAKR